ncbi:hypothetical protein A2U07_08795 [Fusobacterium necrophorum subsp. funduliforme]|uniref:DUF3310 domain-containing protein n=1 Tax=Fusobacterium necrophorum TaxID=859 RepID=UPI00078937AF|nr:DUF3310 domain-containing protein [Fusobacterium necrophorum]KYM57614.1 hypothetical protein A2U07_08795 [Fusobacterium necrophorum subsp. funduliforme]
MIDYAKKIKEYRQEHGISQKEMADLLSVTQPFLSMLESGKIKAESENLKKKIEDLLEIQEEPTLDGKTAKEVLEAIVEKEEQREDTIHSPSHYKIKGCKFESIHLLTNTIEALPGNLAFYVGNAIKYLIRAEKKNGREDYEKAKVYLQWAVDCKYEDRGYSEDEIAESLGTDWLTIISGICDGMSLKKGFTMNEIFKAIITCDYELALRYVDTLLTL